MPTQPSRPEYLFDLYGVIDVLSSSSNKAITEFANGMALGTIKVMRRTSDELRDTQPDLYKKFQALKSGSVYLTTTAAHSAVQQTLMETYGTGWFGGSPAPEHFESVAVCRSENLTLVTAEKSLSNCRNIARKCNLSTVNVFSVSDFEANV